MENIVKKHLLKKENKPEYSALPDSFYYRKSREASIGVFEDYFNDAFVDEPISKALFLKIIDVYFEGLGYTRSTLSTENFIAQASEVLNNGIQQNISFSEEFPCSQECFRYNAYELNWLREPTESPFGTYKAIYQTDIVYLSSSLAAKVISVKLDIGKLKTTGPPYYSSTDKYHYTLEADRILLAPISPSIFR